MSVVNELSELLDKEIAVTMSDGFVYRGRLKKYDEKTIILEDVYEATNKDVDWVETVVKTKDGEKVKTVKGFIHWRKIMLPRVFIQLKWVLRFWPWEAKES